MARLVKMKQDALFTQSAGVVGRERGRALTGAATRHGWFNTLAQTDGRLLRAYISIPTSWSARNIPRPQFFIHALAPPVFSLLFYFNYNNVTYFLNTSTHTFYIVYKDSLYYTHITLH